MKHRLYYSPESRQDLDDIWNYIIMDLCNPDAALHVVNDIMDAVDSLQDFSESGAPLSSLIDTESDYRFLVHGNYMVFYRVVNQNAYIDRVLYGRRDYMRILFQSSNDSNETKI